MTKSYLFFAEKDELTILGMKLKGDTEFQLEFLKYLGEKTYPIPMNFWEWWKKAVSYTLDDCMDFCFVCDKEYEFMKDEFLCKVQTPEETSWSPDHLEDFFQAYTSYYRVELKGQDGDEVELRLQGKESAGMRGKFFVNLCGIAESYAITIEEPTQEEELEPKNVIETFANCAHERFVNEKMTEKRKFAGKTSDFARYFKDLLESERD